MYTYSMYLHTVKPASSKMHVLCNNIVPTLFTRCLHNNNILANTLHACIHNIKYYYTLQFTTAGRELMIISHGGICHLLSAPQRFPQVNLWNDESGTQAHIALQFIVFVVLIREYTVSYTYSWFESSSYSPFAQLDCTCKSTLNVEFRVKLSSECFRWVWNDNTKTK